MTQHNQTVKTNGTMDYSALLDAYSALRQQVDNLTIEVAQLRAQIKSTSQSVEPAKLVLNNGLGMLTGLKTDPAAISPEAVVAPMLDLVASGQRDEAQSLARMSVQVTPGNPTIHMRWVRQLRCRKEFGLALDMCNACFPADGDLPVIRLDRGYLLFESGEYAAAAEDLEIAANGRPHSIEERLIAVSARKRIGQAADAEQSQLMAGFFNPTAATFSANKFDPIAVKRSLQRYGCAWIQGLFDPNELTEFDRVISSNITDITDVYRILGVPDSYSFVGFPLYFAAEVDRQKCQQAYQNSYPAMFNPDKMAGLDNTKLPKFVFRALHQVGLNKVIAEYLGMERLYVSPAACHIRSMHPDGSQSFGEFHQDNRLYNSDAEIMTIWFPFRYQHGPMPSLEFLPVRSDSHFPCISECGIDNQIFDPEIFWRPSYMLGDAMLLSGFSPHRTYFEADMTLERTSIDFRIFASSLPAPIYEPG
jgi:hypothetical protein